MKGTRVEYRYYVIFSILVGDDDSRLYPLVYDDKSSADKDFIELTSRDGVTAASLGLDFDNADSIIIEPFLYIEKTIITEDIIVGEETILGTTEGVINSDFIPMDYVSNVYFKNNIKKTNSSGYIDSLIYEAERVL